MSALGHILALRCAKKHCPAPLGAFSEGKMLNQDLLFCFGASDGISSSKAQSAKKKAVKSLAAPARVGRHCEINRKTKFFEFGRPRFLTDHSKTPWEEGICAVNETWSMLLPELQVKHIRCNFRSDARLPWPEKPEGYETIYREGVFRLQTEPGIDLKLICAPDYKSADLFMDIGNRYEYDEYRQIFIRAMDLIAGVMETTYYARLALMAARKKPPNKGYVDRSFGDLFRKIGAILPITPAD